VCCEHGGETDGGTEHGVRTPSIMTTIGLVLAPLVGLLIVIEFVMVVSPLCQPSLRQFPSSFH
jgi:hypothetical protein